jgi:hypothetical protein
MNAILMDFPVEDLVHALLDINDKNCAKTNNG